MKCYHDNCTLTNRTPEFRDGIEYWFQEYECNDCGEKWRNYKRQSTNIKLDRYIEHLQSPHHSPNSPYFIRWEEGETRSGCYYGDPKEVSTPCEMCKQWASQHHHGID